MDSYVLIPKAMLLAEVKRLRAKDKTLSLEEAYIKAYGRCAMRLTEGDKLTTRQKQVLATMRNLTANRKDKSLTQKPILSKMIKDGIAIDDQALYRDMKTLAELGLIERPGGVYSKRWLVVADPPQATPKVARKRAGSAKAGSAAPQERAAKQAA